MSSTVSANPLSSLTLENRLLQDGPSIYLRIFWGRAVPDARSHSQHMILLESARLALIELRQPKPYAWSTPISPSPEGSPHGLGCGWDEG